MEFICGNSPHVKAVSCFHREAPSLMFDRILNVTLPEDKVSTTGVTQGNLKLLLRSSSFFFFFFFYLGFLSRTFTIHGTAGEGGGYLFNSSLPLPPASQTLRH